MSYARNKYRAKRCERDGFQFDSLMERSRYDELKLLERAGHIWALDPRPPRYALVVKGQTVGHYKPDFEYCRHDERGEFERVTEDVKGCIARDFPLRKKLFEALYGRKVYVITKKTRRKLPDDFEVKGTWR